jgi:hypothetical protein
MENDFIKLHSEIQPELIEVKTEGKKVPKRITIVYELTTPKDENFSEKNEQDQS